MAYKIIIKEHAKEDTEIAYNHYENERKGLGEEFIDELIKRYDDLESKPYNYGYIDDQAIIRDVKLDRFPYVIVFEIVQESVVVFSIHCTYKHPKKRLRK